MFGKIQQQLIKQVKTTHRENLQKNLQQRLESARMAGNTNLVQQLEAEADYLDLK